MLKENGGNYSKGPDWQPYVSIDKNLVTGQNPKSSEGVAWLFLDKLLNRESSENKVLRPRRSGISEGARSAALPARLAERA